MIQELETVALTQDLPKAGLKAGDVGTVVMVYEGGKGYEVEFMTYEGETVAVETLRADQVAGLTNGEIPSARTRDKAA